MHYRRVMNGRPVGPAGPVVKEPSPVKICSLDYCDIPLYARGFCRGHYEQDRRGRPLTPLSQHTDEMTTCEAPGCENKFPQRRWGSARRHCSRACKEVVLRQGKLERGYVPPHKRPDATPCSVEGCEKPKVARGWCPMHLERVRKYGEPGEAESRHRPGEWRPTNHGYMIRWLDGVQELQHRVVMEEHLGRPLWPDETPHHKNGDRADNRIENLELWSTHQPAGQRVTDKLEYAYEIIARYADAPRDVIT